MVLLHHHHQSNATTSGSLLERADLTHPIPENARKLAQLVEYDESRVELGSHSVFVREARPPGAHYAKATVIFLHGQSFSSSTWTENNLLRTFAALGYRAIAIDLPGSGQTRGAALAQTAKPTFLMDFVETLGLKQVMVVCASMASQYVLPLMTSNRHLACVVAVAPSNTHEVVNPASYIVPTLVLWGDRDTSLGPTAAANLKNLPMVKLQKVPDAGHACYLHNPKCFENLCINFFELIRSYH
uniref:AB hydrolase-1 domain-containing protein n=1 Tax=Caenorhabditis japonica TaxID=281687 RepID=A0A8R1HXC5_CAEJA